MSLLKRAGAALSAVKDTAAENARLVAQAASDGAENLSDEVRGRAAITKRKIGDALARPYPEGLDGLVDHLLTHQQDRFYFAAALSSAEANADEDTSWDEILKAALLDLKASPREVS